MIDKMFRHIPTSKDVEPEMSLSVICYAVWGSLINQNILGIDSEIIKAAFHFGCSVSSIYVPDDESEIMRHGVIDLRF